MLCLQMACRNCSERRKTLHHQDVVITTGEGEYCPVPTETRYIPIEKSCRGQAL